jgi:pyridoxine/pyridoxamine 5'-phosphate oxidase
VTDEPTRSRPRFAPGYGIAEGDQGLLDWAWAVERLEGSRNYWIATARADGSPHAAPVWGLWIDGAVVFGTDPGSRKAKNLARDRRVSVNLESGDEVVILEGLAEPFYLDERVADVYAKKYDFRPEPGHGDGWFRVEPRVAYAWTERDYPATVTRFSFE